MEEGKKTLRGVYGVLGDPFEWPGRWTTPAAPPSSPWTRLPSFSILEERREVPYNGREPRRRVPFVPKVILWKEN